MIPQTITPIIPAITKPKKIPITTAKAPLKSELITPI